MISTPPAYLVGVGIVAAHQHRNSIIGLSSPTAEKMKVHLAAKNIEDIKLKPLIIIVENVLLHVHVVRVKRMRRVAAGANHRYQYLVLLLRDHQNLDAADGRSKSASYAKDALKQLCNIEILFQECIFVPVYHEEDEIHL